MGPWPHGNPTTQASSPCPADDWSADADGPHPYSKSPTGGVYALWRRPHPSRPHVRVPWPDFGLPLDSRQARAAIDQALQLSTHHRVERSSPWKWCNRLRGMRIRPGPASPPCPSRCPVLA